MKHKPNIMIQGTASSVGKSLVATALCRIFKEDGFQPVPFKSQNMSLNSYITEDGFEMGRAQVAQAEAAGLKPDVAMNPILIKPTGDQTAQIMVGGQVWKNLTAEAYQGIKPQLKSTVLNYYEQLEHKWDLLVIEGAGSPAEINLQENDLVNMGFAEMVDAPVILVGDIDKGGVFASLVGTMALLPEKDRKRVKGFIINKFRGDITILKPGLDQLEEMTGIPVLGVIPYDQFDIEEEDGTAERLGRKGHKEGIEVVVLRLPRISNFTDFHWLEMLEGVHLSYTDVASEVGVPDLLIIPGTKNTLEDLAFVRQRGLEEAVKKAYEAGSMICGICGGFQMLGTWLHDPHKVESDRGTMEGMGLLDVHTTFSDKKTTLQVEGTSLDQYPVKGYEIHMGQSNLQEKALPFARVKGINEKTTRNDGAISQDGQVWGTYIHGIFDNQGFVEALLKKLKEKTGKDTAFTITETFDAYKERQYVKLADSVRKSIDLAQLYHIMGLQVGD